MICDILHSRYDVGDGDFARVFLNRCLCAREEDSEDVGGGQILAENAVEDGVSLRLFLKSAMDV